MDTTVLFGVQTEEATRVFRREWLAKVQSPVFTAFVDQSKEADTTTAVVHHQLPVSSQHLGLLHRYFEHADEHGHLLMDDLRKLFSFAECELLLQVVDKLGLYELKASLREAFPLLGTFLFPVPAEEMLYRAIPFTGLVSIKLTGELSTFVLEPRHHQHHPSSTPSAAAALVVPVLQLRLSEATRLELMSPSDQTVFNFQFESLPTESLGAAPSVPRNPRAPPPSPSPLPLPSYVIFPRLETHEVVLMNNVSRSTTMFQIPPA